MLFDLSKDINEGISNYNHVMLICLDLKKAFDLCDITRLLTKLEAMVIR